MKAKTLLICMFTIVCLVFMGIIIKLFAMSVIAHNPNSEYLRNYPLFFTFAKYAAILSIIMSLSHLIMSYVYYYKYFHETKGLLQSNFLTSIFLILAIGLSSMEISVYASIAVSLEGFALCIALFFTAWSVITNFRYIMQS
ncbi:MAG: hypothetical protein LBG80_15460 [Bacteroidales bacterium]|nr:hypothetical protein [Bacteroidales bacterium]